MAKESNDKKNWFARHKIITVILVVAVIAGIASAANGGGEDAKKVADSTSSTSSSSNETQQTKFKVGEVVAFDGKEVAVKSVERNWDSGNQFITSDGGKEYVKVEVQIENKSNSEAGYNVFDWKVQDSNGTITDVDSSVFTVDGALNSGELASGGKVTGFLIFEVPSGDAGLIYRYEPSFWSDKKVEITE